MQLDSNWISHTDGLLDYVKPKDLGELLAKALYSECKDISENKGNERLHSSLAVEELILRAAQSWFNDMDSQYRDDIAVAVMKIVWFIKIIEQYCR